MPLEETATVATVIGTLVALVSLVLSPDFRRFLGHLIQTKAFWKFSGIIAIFVVGIVLGTYLREIFPKKMY